MSNISIPPVDSQAPKNLRDEHAQLTERAAKLEADRQEVANVREEAQTHNLLALTAGHVAEPARALAASVVDDEMQLRHDIVAFAKRSRSAHSDLLSTVPSWDKARERAAQRLKDAGWEVPDVSSYGGYGYLQQAVNSHPDCKAAAARVEDIRGLINSAQQCIRTQEEAIDALEEKIALARRRLLASPV